jgi:hypothetical protein
MTATKPTTVGVKTLNRGVTNDVLTGLIEKHRIINELIQGKVTLREAAMQFQQAHIAAGNCIERATGVPSRFIEMEKTCHTLIGWVRLTLKDRPEYADRITARLEQEMI